MSALRKPVKAEGERAVRCYCRAPESAHPTSDCAVFQPRPCVCGHAHTGSCSDCTCRRYREDATPEPILREGLRAGQWGIAELPRIAALMRPDQRDPTVRVWACLMVHILDRRGKKRNQARLVTRFVVDGKGCFPLSPQDVVDELNALDTIPRLDRHAVRKELRELERLGIVRVVGVQKNSIRIFLYARPLRFRTLPKLADGPEPKPKDPNLGVWLDPRNPLSARNETFLREHIDSPIRAALVKTFSRAIRQLDLKGVQLDPQKLVDEIVDEAVKGVQSAYQTAFKGVCQSPQNSTPEGDGLCHVPRTRAASSSSLKEDRAGGRPSVVVEEPPPVEAAPARPPDLLVQGLTKRKLLPDGDLLDGVRYVIGAMPVEEFFWVLDDRLKRGRIGTGLLMDMAKKAAKQWEATEATRVKVPLESSEEKDRRQAETFLASEDAPEDLKEWARGILASQAVGAGGD